MSSLSHPELRQRIVDSANRLVRTGILSRSQHGNISIRIPDTDQMLLTGVSTLAGVTPESLARVTLTGEVLEGHLDPTSREIIDMHGIVYKRRGDVGSVIHTHSPFSTAYAVASKPLEITTAALARLGVAQAIPVSQFGPRGSEVAVRYIEETVDANPGCRALLLENHGILTFDGAIETATQMVFAMEETAETSILASAIGQPKVIPPHLILAAEQRRVEFERLGTASA